MSSSTVSSKNKLLTLVFLVEHKSHPLAKDALVIKPISSSHTQTEQESSRPDEPDTVADKEAEEVEEVEEDQVDSKPSDDKADEKTSKPAADDDDDDDDDEWEPPSRDAILLRRTKDMLEKAQYSRVLLGMKKKGFGVGKWNGFGGKVEKGETVVQAAVREMKEECGLEVSDLERRAVIIQEFEKDPVKLEIHVFMADAQKAKGEIKESAEMEPQWFNLVDIPFEEMWKDDVHWYPYVFSDYLIRGHFLFRGHEEILTSNVDAVDEQNELDEPL